MKGDEDLIGNSISIQPNPFIDRLRIIDQNIPEYSRSIAGALVPPILLCIVFFFSVDNSDWTRNGDYQPTRFLAQNEAVSYLANAKLQENQESSVGLMAMAGSRIQVLCSPGREPGQLCQK